MGRLKGSGGAAPGGPGPGPRPHRPVLPDGRRPGGAVGVLPAGSFVPCPPAGGGESADALPRPPVRPRPAGVSPAPFAGPFPALVEVLEAPRALASLGRLAARRLPAMAGPAFFGSRPLVCPPGSPRRRAAGAPGHRSPPHPVPATANPPPPLTWPPPDTPSSPTPHGRQSTSRSRRQPDIKQQTVKRRIAATGPTTLLAAVAHAMHNPPFNALVVKWISHRSPEPGVWVRFPARVFSLRRRYFCSLSRYAPYTH